MDGIPVWWAPAPGPLMATLGFRVGAADEPFAQRGITHLVEHLALFPLGRQRYHYNATVDEHETTFDVRGDREEVLGHLRAVAAGLRALPLDRFEDEVRVLRTESLGRGSGLAGRLRHRRYGALPYGVSAFREFGLRHLTPDDVQRWATERFCAENAVVWMTGEPPETLGLDLPHGQRRPMPSADPLPRLELPAYLPDEDATVAVAVVAPADDFEPVRTVLAVARNRLYDRLRRDCAMIYDVRQRHSVVGAGGLHAVLSVDHRIEQARQVRDTVLETLRELAADGPTAEELDFEADQTRRYAEDPTATDARLEDAALDELHGTEPLTDPLASVRELTPARCAEALTRAMATAIVQAADELDDVPPGLVRYRTGTLDGPAPDGGRTFHELEETECVHRPCTVTVTGDALFWQAGDGSGSWLLPAGEITGIVREAGDSHLVYTIEGNPFDVSPLAFQDGDALREALVGLVGADRVVPLDARGRRVEEAGERDLTRRELLTEELYRLSRDLYEDEELVLLGEVEDQDGPALFAVTDRRVILHYVARGAEGDSNYRRETARADLSDVAAFTDDDGAAGLRFRIGDAEEDTTLGPMARETADALAAALGGA